MSESNVSNNGAAMTAKVFVGVMAAVGLSISVLSWIASESLDESIKESDEQKKKNFSRSMTMLAVLGAVLMAVSISFFAFSRVCGEENMNSAGGNRMFMGMCAVVAILVIALGSVALSGVDREEDSEGKKAPIWSLVTLISLASVALVVGGIYVVRAPLMNTGKGIAAGVRGAREAMRQRRDGGDFISSIHLPPPTHHRKFPHSPPPLTHPRAAASEKMADYAFDFDF
jgi:NADH:ubiquinone oxidoreductase subunit 5 (subunit L)/multisubunit Na+/H+ antiporter MnhA subunit